QRESIAQEVTEIDNARRSIIFAERSHQKLQSLQLDNNEHVPELVSLQSRSSSLSQDAVLYDSQVPLPAMKEDNEEAIVPAAVSGKRAQQESKGMAANNNNNNNNNTDNGAGSLLSNTREIDRGNAFMLREFFWPTVYFEKEEKLGQDKFTLEHLSKIVYPSRIYGAAYLGELQPLFFFFFLTTFNTSIITLIGLLGILGQAYIFRYWYRRVGNFIQDAKVYKSQIEALQPPSNPIVQEDYSSGQQWAIDTTSNLIKLAEALHQGLLCGGIYGIIFGLCACMLLFRAWKKKM
ncbi:hypothetical protein RFI_32108, partial [Reticulomyxa filosa]